MNSVWQTNKNFREQIRQKQIHNIKEKVRQQTLHSLHHTQNMCRLCHQDLYRIENPQILNYNFKEQCQHLFVLLQNEQKYCPAHEVCVVGWIRDLTLAYPILFIEFSKTEQWKKDHHFGLKRILKWIFQMLVCQSIEESLIEGIIHSSICEAIITGFVDTFYEEQDQMDRKIFEALVKEIQVLLVSKYPLIIIAYPYTNILENLLNLDEVYINICIYGCIVELLEHKYELYESNHIQSKLQFIVRGYILSKIEFNRVTEEQMQMMIMIVRIMLFHSIQQISLCSQEDIKTILRWSMGYLLERRSLTMQQLVVDIIHHSNFRQYFLYELKDSHKCMDIIEQLVNPYEQVKKEDHFQYY